MGAKTAVATTVAAVLVFCVCTLVILVVDDQSIAEQQDSSNPEGPITSAKAGDGKSALDQALKQLGWDGQAEKSDTYEGDEVLTETNPEDLRDDGECVLERHESYVTTGEGRECCDKKLSAASARCSVHRLAQGCIQDRLRKKSVAFNACKSAAEQECKRTADSFDIAMQEDSKKTQASLKDSKEPKKHKATMKSIAAAAAPSNPSELMFAAMFAVNAKRNAQHEATKLDSLPTPEVSSPSSEGSSEPARTAENRFHVFHKCLAPKTAACEHTARRTEVHAHKVCKALHTPRSRSCKRAAKDAHAKCMDAL